MASVVAAPHPTPAPPLVSHSTSPSTMPLISPHTILYSSLSQDPPRRPSGRTPTQCRQISINTSSLTNANGSALIKLGATSAVCGVRAEVLPIHEIAGYRVNKSTLAQPSRKSGDDEEEGEISSEAEEDPEGDAIIRTHNLLVPNLELSTGCSPLHLPGSAPSQEAQSLSQRLLSLLHISRLVALSDLVIFSTTLPNSLSESEPERDKKPRKAFWVLYIDIVIINHDGNLFDACALAMFAALRDTILPRAWWDEDLDTVLCSTPQRGQGRKLRLRGCPMPLSFAVFRSNKLEEGVSREQQEGKEEGRRVQQVLCDPDAFEEGCCREQGCVVVDVNSERGAVVRKMEKNGGGVLDGSGLRDVVGLAAERWHEWQIVLRREDDSKNNKR